ncbi:MAG: hypothetical protein ACLQMO_02115 [Acidobacteriaceae bacterium]
MSASVFAVLGVVFFCLGAYWAWAKERKIGIALEEKMMLDAPRMSIEVVLGAGEAPVRIRIRNDGPTEMHSPHLNPITIAGSVVSFPELIGIIAPNGGVSRDLLPTGPGVFGRHDLRQAMMKDWDTQGGMDASKLEFPATGAFCDRHGNKFTVSWKYEMNPFDSFFQAKKEREPRASFIPNAHEMYLTVRAVTQRRAADTE